MVANILFLYILLFIGLVYSIIKERYFISLVLKTGLAICFVTLAIISVTFKAIGMFGLLVTLGLFFSALGDIYLGINKIENESKNYYFEFGVLLFFVAQLFYFLASLDIMKFYVLSLPIATMMITLLVMLFREVFKENNNAKYLLVYALLLKITTVNSILNCLAIQHPVIIFFTLGITLYWLSDLVLFFNIFGSYKKRLDILNKILYYSAQILLVFSLCKI